MAHMRRIVDCRAAIVPVVSKYVISLADGNRRPSDAPSNVLVPDGDKVDLMCVAKISFIGASCQMHCSLPSTESMNSTAEASARLLTAEAAASAPHSSCHETALTLRCSH